MALRTMALGTTMTLVTTLETKTMTEMTRLPTVKTPTAMMETMVLQTTMGTAETKVLLTTKEMTLGMIAAMRVTPRTTNYRRYSSLISVSNFCPTPLFMDLCQ